MAGTAGRLDLDKRERRRTMDSILNCGAGSWLMIAAGIVTYGVLGLAGAALVKYLFFAEPRHGTA